MKELGITKGEWNVNGEYYRNKVMVNNSTIHVYHTVVTFDGAMVTYNNAKANAVLIADAGNTAQKCGLLPSELLRQRDELREALAAMVDQFAYRIKSSEAETLHTMGLSALEDAFDALRIPDPISQENFDAAIKNTETK